MLCIIIHTFEKITCARCFSTDIYKFGKNNFGIQKYQCKHCKRQFTLEKPISKSKGYPKCPICQKATYIWHKYDTYLHFKCGNRKCNYSFKLPIEFDSKLLKSFKFKTKMSFKRFRHPANIILLALTLYYDGNSSTRAIKRILKAIYNFKNFESAVALITTFIYHYNFLHQHSSLNNLTLAIVAGASYSTKDIKNWMLF